MTADDLRRGGNRWEGRDWLITAALFLAAFLIRIPFRTNLLYAWDSVLYTRAIEHFDVTVHQPQPPGHIFYVGLVWLVNRLFGDPNAAMVWISIFFAAAAVAALYWLGRIIFGRDAGLAAALLLATSLSFWSLSEVALPYTLLGFLSTIVAGIIYLAWEGRGSWVLPASLALALASGFRQDLLPFLLPLLALGIWNKGRWRLAGAAGLLVMGIAAWYIPSALLSGGFGPYREASSLQSDYLMTYFSVFGIGAAALATNTSTLLHFLFYGLSAALALVPVFLLMVLLPRTRGRFWDRRILFLAIWMVPSLLFYIFIHIGELGYVFSFLPAALLLGVRGLQIFAGWLVKRKAGKSDTAVSAANATRLAQWIVSGLAMAMVAVNMFMFLILSPPLSANRLAARDGILGSKIDTIKARFRPDSTFIVSVFDYQQALYYLPGYRHWCFDPSVEQDPSIELPPGVDKVIIFEEYLSAADGQRADTLPLSYDQKLIYLDPAGKRSVRVDWDTRKVFLEDE